MVLEKALLSDWDAKERVKNGDTESFANEDADRRMRRGNGQGRSGTDTPPGAVEGVFPRHVMLILRGVDAALEGMEKILRR